MAKIWAISTLLYIKESDGVWGGTVRKPLTILGGGMPGSAFAGAHCLVLTSNLPLIGASYADTSG
jgi:hypothetical protein